MSGRVVGLAGVLALALLLRAACSPAPDAKGNLCPPVSRAPRPAAGNTAEAACAARCELAAAESAEHRTAALAACLRHVCGFETLCPPAAPEVSR